jgi:predicted ATPase
VEYWRRAGQCAIERSANPEAAQHLTKGLELLATLPETQARAQQELDLQLALGPVLAAIKSWATPEVEQTYARARVLCQQVGETPQLFPALRGLCWFYINRGALPTARELGEQLLSRLAQREATPMLRLAGHAVLGSTLFHQGELFLRQALPDASQAEANFQQALAVARRQQAKLWELRAALSLCRLWQRQGKRAEARELLTPIYSWFTEGFDTADLQEAKALLTALA